MTDYNAEVEAFMAWRERARRMHRVMTQSEYNAWQVVGDCISHPSNASAMMGGVTIIPDDGNKPYPYLGRLIEKEENKP